MAQELITKAEFARRAGVSGGRITKLTHPGQRLHGAVRGKRIDACSPDALKYLIDRGDDPTRGQLGANAPTAPPTQPRAHTGGHRSKRYQESPSIPKEGLDLLPDDIREVSHLPLVDIINIFGTDYRFKEWLDALKRIEEIADKRIKNAKLAGDLIDKSIVKSGVVDHFDRAHRLLLTDGSRAMAQRLQGKFKGGTTPVEAEKYIRDSISKILQPAKKKIADTLRRKE